MGVKLSNEKITKKCKEKTPCKNLFHDHESKKDPKGSKLKSATRALKKAHESGKNSDVTPKERVISAAFFFAIISFVLFQYFSHQGTETYSVEGKIDDSHIEYRKYSSGGAYSSISVEGAYKTLKRSRVQFRFNDKYMTLEEGIYLTELFQLTDKALVEKAEMFVQGAKGRVINEYTIDNDAIVRELKSIIVPDKFRIIHALLTDGIAEHKFFFQEWKRDITRPYDMNDKWVQSSHQKIYRAYLELIKMYPDDKYNKQAFFSHLYHLCLD